MGYSKSMKALEQVRFILEPLVQSDSAVEFPSPQPDRLAYLIRQGIFVAKTRVAGGSQSSDLIAFADLNSKYKITSVEGKVICEPRSLNPLQALKVSMNKMVLSEPTSFLEIIGAAIQHKADEMYFPNVNVDMRDMNSIFNWASKNNYHIINHADGITLTKNPGEAEVWKP